MCLTRGSLTTPEVIDISPPPATQSITSGAVFPFSERQISQIIARYQSLSGAFRIAFSFSGVHDPKNFLFFFLPGIRSMGRNITPSLAWLIGAVMPLDAVGTRVNNRGLAAVLNGDR